MERIFFVKNGELKEVNNWLQKGGRVKHIHAVPENVSCGTGGYNEGDIYAYVVVEFD